jgi:hypothetical protein
MLAMVDTIVQAVVRQLTAEADTPRVRVLAELALRQYSPAVPAHNDYLMQYPFGVETGGSK